MSNEKEFLSEFIEVYKSFPCLWQIKSKEYSDRNAKSHVYDALIEKMRSFDQEADRETVVKKSTLYELRTGKKLKKVHITHPILGVI